MRARDHGIVTGRLAPGPLNAITDVAGVRVGHTTLVRGDGPRVVGEGPGPHGGDASWSPTTAMPSWSRSSPAATASTATAS